MTNSLRPVSPIEIADPSRRDIVVGLVNNMPHRSQDTCERRFRSLFSGVYGGRKVTWRLYDATAQSRGAGRASAHGGVYEELDALFGADLDALVVTGAEPQSVTMIHEPMWNVVVKVINWAETTGVPVLWSCLASHAAVNYMDGIERTRLARKLSGLYSCTFALPDSSLLDGVQFGASNPHSRWHALRSQDLEEAGYEILATCNGTEVDTFCRSRGARFLFCQGHPEYDVDTLWLEYRRDLIRFLNGDTSLAPELPENYLSGQVAARVRSLGAECRDPLAIRKALQRIEASPGFLSGLDHWISAGTRLCSNWLRTAMNVEPVFGTGVFPSGTERCELGLGVSP